MTPEVAKREMKAAAEERGLYEVTWHNAGRGAVTGEMAPDTIRALRIVAAHPDGIGSYALSKELGEPHNITGNRVDSLNRHSYITARKGDKGANGKAVKMLTITEKGIARLAREDAKE